MAESGVTQSDSRLRIGVLMFVIWWLPVWLLTPIFTHIFSNNSSKSILAIIVIIQTAIGVAGATIAGKQVIVDNTPDER